jgi:peptide/nickel transport system permease protein
MTVHAPEQPARADARPTQLLKERPQGRLRAALRRRNLDLWIPGTLLGLLVAACFLVPLVGAVADPLAGDLTETLRPLLSRGHLLGTDTIGRDVLSRVLYGGRISIEVALGVNVVGIVIGGLIGTFAGFRGGATESVITRLLDMLLAFPALVLAMVVATYLGSSELNVILAISFFSVPAYARLARAATLGLREQVYVSAARLSGRSDRAILLRHIAPNVVPQLLTYSLLQVGIVVVIEATLSFLGIGIPASEPSWGNMISSGQVYLSTNPALVLVPSAFLFVTVMCLNLLGDGLRTRWGKMS